MQTAGRARVRRLKADSIVRQSGRAFQIKRGRLRALQQLATCNSRASWAYWNTKVPGTLVPDHLPFWHFNRAARPDAPFNVLQAPRWPPFGWSGRGVRRAGRCFCRGPIPPSWVHAAADRPSYAIAYKPYGPLSHWHRTIVRPALRGRCEGSSGKDGMRPFARIGAAGPVRTR